MKNQVIKRLKKTVAAVLTVSMLVGLGMIASAKDEIYDSTKGIRYADKGTDVTAVQNYFTNDTAPEDVTEGNQGYLFGGWFAKVGNTYKPLADTTLPEGNDGHYYAKYVPAQVLSVKCQNLADTGSGSATTNMKIVTGVDSLNYAKVGFDINTVKVGDGGKTLTSNKDLAVTNDTNVYRKLTVTGKGEYTAEQAFGANTGAQYFATTWVNGIKAANFESIVCIQPYWETLDGAKVYGLTKYAHVIDGLEVNATGEMETGGGHRWVNVPINVRDDQGVAAGVLSVANPSEVSATLPDLVCTEIECGVLFEEMDFAIKTGNDVKLVGNLSNMTTDKTANTIYANLRYLATSADAQAILTGYSFAVSDVDFANINEDQFASKQFPVWNIAY